MAELLNDKPTGNHLELPTDTRTVLLAHRTELVSEITQSVANQFNNFMMAITGYAELEMKTASSSQRRSLEQVLNNARQATDLVQKLLAISRKQPSSPQPLDLNHKLAGIRAFLEQLLGDRISVVYKLDPGISLVNADSAEIEQAVLSLALNARSAMANGGKLTIGTELVYENIDPSQSSEIDGLGKYVMLSIADTGLAGTMEDADGEENNNHQESVVTNAHASAQDSRVNLSLAAVRGIMKNAGGTVRFSNDPSTGSNFKIYFPALKQEGQQDSKRRSLRTIPVARTILVVEDDDAVRIPTSEFLKMEGFKVLQARTGEEALHVVQQNRSRLDVLITDIVMPKMTGIQVADKLIELNSDLKVLFMSGNTEDVSQSRAGDPSANAVLRKPFRLDALTARIHDLLGE